MKLLLTLFAYALSLGSFALSRLIPFRGTHVRHVSLLGPKMAATAGARQLAVAGAVGAALGLLRKKPLAVIAGLAGALTSFDYIMRVSSERIDMSLFFGPDWESKIPPRIAARFMTSPRGWKMPRVPRARFTQNVTYATVPDCRRDLLCDIWEPPQGIEPSGVAFVYSHGSAWHFLDKDFLTRPFFGYLAAQGHVIMDIAYRLCPETDLWGQVCDVKRAVGWMKDNAPRYGVDPGRIVLAGGSAGAHLALLAAYAPHHPDFTPEDLRESDLSVEAVVSIYGPTDLVALYEYSKGVAPEGPAAQRGFQKMKVAEIRKLAQQIRYPAPQELEGLASVDAIIAASAPQLFVNMLGGTPEEILDRYELASPVSHVGPHCPPTLLFHGSHDALVPVETVRTLYRKLVRAGVPVDMAEYAYTEHAFDISLPTLGPATRSMMHDLERFLALAAVAPFVTYGKGAAQSPEPAGELSAVS